MYLSFRSKGVNIGLYRRQQIVDTMLGTSHFGEQVLSCLFGKGFYCEDIIAKTYLKHFSETNNYLDSYVQWTRNQSLLRLHIV